MAINEMHAIDVPQGDYDDGVRLYYCGQCPAIVMGEITGSVQCVACIAIEVPGEPIDPENPPEVVPEKVFERRSLLEAPYNEELEQFIWTKEIGGGI